MPAYDYFGAFSKMGDTTRQLTQDIDAVPMRKQQLRLGEQQLKIGEQNIRSNDLGYESASLDYTKDKSAYERLQEELTNKDDYLRRLEADGVVKMRQLEFPESQISAFQGLIRNAKTQESLDEALLKSASFFQAINYFEDNGKPPMARPQVGEAIDKYVERAEPHTIKPVDEMLLEQMSDEKQYMQVLQETNPGKSMDVLKKNPKIDAQLQQMRSRGMQTAVEGSTGTVADQYSQIAAEGYGDEASKRADIQLKEQQLSLEEIANSVRSIAKAGAPDKALSEVEYQDLIAKASKNEADLEARLASAKNTADKASLEALLKNQKAITRDIVKRKMDSVINEETPTVRSGLYGPANTNTPDETLFDALVEKYNPKGWNGWGFGKNNPEQFKQWLLTQGISEDIANNLRFDPSTGMPVNPYRDGSVGGRSSTGGSSTGSGLKLNIGGAAPSDATNQRPAGFGYSR